MRMTLFQKRKLEVIRTRRNEILELELEQYDKGCYSCAYQNNRRAFDATIQIIGNGGLTPSEEEIMSGIIDRAFKYLKIKAGRFS